MIKNKKRTEGNRNQFLLSFFSSEPHYEVVEVNGFFLEKQINGTTGEPIVAIYTADKWENKQAFLQKTHPKLNNNGDELPF
jgi:hypothetical protein